MRGRAHAQPELERPLTVLAGIGDVLEVEQAGGEGGAADTGGPPALERNPGAVGERREHLFEYEPLVEAWIVAVLLARRGLRA